MSQLEDEGRYFAAYQDYSRTLRTWLVCYGVGALVLLLARDTLWVAVASSPSASLIVAAFLWAISLQAALVLINKAAMWALYYGESEPSFKEGWEYRLLNRFTSQFWIDLGIDMVSVALLAAATYGVFLSLLAPG